MIYFSYCSIPSSSDYKVQILVTQILTYAPEAEFIWQIIRQKPENKEHFFISRFWGYLGIKEKWEAEMTNLLGKAPFEMASRYIAKIPDIYLEF